MCGYYLAIGMSLDEYWCASPNLVKFYRNAHRLKAEKKNQELWLQGLYIYNAFSVVLANAFRKKGARTHSYLDKPLDIFGKPEEDSAAEKARVQNEVVGVLNRFAAKHKAKNTTQGTEGLDNGD